MAIFLSVVGLLFCGWLVLNILDLWSRVRIFESDRNLTATKLVQMRNALDSANAKVESLTNKCDTAYQMANNAILRGERTVTVRLKRVRTKPRAATVASPVPPPLLKKAGVKSGDMEVWT